MNIDDIVNVCRNCFHDEGKEVKEKYNSEYHMIDKLKGVMGDE